MLAEAKTRSSEIIAQGEKLKSETVDAAKADAKAEADRILAAAKAEIEQEIARAKESLRDQVADLAVAGAAKILKREVDAKAHADLLGVDPARALDGRAMAELTTIARPYAEAAFELARDANALPAWSSMLRYASAVVADPAMARALDNPKLTAADKESLLLSVCGDRLDASAGDFVRVLVEADRVALLPQIAALFDDAQERRRGRRHGAHRQRVSADRRAGRGTQGGAREAFRQEDRGDGQRRPRRSIGGARITVGDTVIDASVRAQLQAMAIQLRA